jgi:hypothetical protein
MMQRLAELTLERDAAAAAATASARQAKLAEDDAVSLRDRICMLQAAAAAAAATMVEPLKSEVGVSEQLGGQAAQVSGAFPALTRLTRSIVTGIYLCHTCACPEMLRMETPGQQAFTPPRARRHEAAAAAAASAIVDGSGQLTVVAAQRSAAQRSAGGPGGQRHPFNDAPCPPFTSHGASIRGRDGLPWVAPPCALLLVADESGAAVQSGSGVADESGAVDESGAADQSEVHGWDRLSVLAS